MTLFYIYFYYDDKEMKNFQIESNNIGQAVKEAIDTISGIIVWNRIRVRS